MDSQQLRTLVFERTGVKLDVDDPAFALVALNQAVLDEAVQRHVAMLDASRDALRVELDALAARAAQPVWPRMAALAGGAAVLGALLVLAGQALWFRPPAAAPAPAAAPLTPEQQAALRNGEKLARIVDRLDRKTRGALEAKLNKP